MTATPPTAPKEKEIEKQAHQKIGELPPDYAYTKVHNVGAHYRVNVYIFTPPTGDHFMGRYTIAHSFYI